MTPLPLLHNDACVVPQVNHFDYEKSVSDFKKNESYAEFTPNSNSIHIN